MKEFSKLVRIMKKLRHPRRGCPWDLKQTPASLKEYVLEEAHELIEAIDGGDAAAVREEMGDLLLQIVFLAQIAAEEGTFTIADVIDGIAGKLVRRHPHIFGSVTVSGADEVKANWEQIKVAEKNKQSVISDYPLSMPSLLLANRIASQASGVGFDWDDAAKALDKVSEEVAELRAEIAGNRRHEAEDEIGDLLFAVANVARLLQINPEFALARANRKFTCRFRFIEAELLRQGREIGQASLAEMEELWQRAKTEE
ncbi:MAG: nucleoside triphosphate pyrophosphohydrolase [Acidobacteria bacterium]|jgi:MazG family protein|nr:nucleoside triphosphate pyrophosphohydrolase [Acidobacteriota bacterium]